MNIDLDKRPAIGSRGVIVTNHPLGSAAGAEMLAAGGNAIDAAIAALFALTVVEPMMVGIFGAGMANVRRDDGSHWFINNYAVAPAAATPEMYRTVSNTWPDYQKTRDDENDVGPLAVGVPGSLAGWCETLDRCGRLSLEDVLRPAIGFAANGFRATAYLSGIVRAVAPSMSRFPETSKIYLPDGNPIREGDLVVQRDYAETLKNIAKFGPNFLYQGELGASTVDYLQSIGGIITAADLKNYGTVIDTVVSGSYRGYRVIGPPPPSAGGVQVIEMLNILEGFDLASMGFGSVDSIHVIAETLKLGFEDRKQYTGDPAFVDVPVTMLTSTAYADKRRQEIDMRRARSVTDTASGESPHTTHVTAADADGNVIATTQTIHAPFGSKVMVPGTGMLLNNTMNIFDPHPGFANSIAPGKRMTSSMSPLIVMTGDEPWFALGLPGATRIFPSAMQAVINVIDHGMDPQTAVEAPRIWTQGQELEIEQGFEQSVLRGIERRGHALNEVRLIGGGMGMVVFKGGTMTGSSCWRADGTPIAVSGGMARLGSRFDVR
ncbi:MAG: gamma-glutamyltransferase [Pseudomonadales bacterium]|nr:gamma-glutamyltransferase [Pseudomonadales bacterium]